MKSLLFWFFMLCCSFQMAKGQAAIDLAPKAYSGVKSQETLDAMIDLYDLKYKDDDDSIISGNKLLFDALHLAKELKSQQGILECSFRLGTNFNIQSNVTKAVEFYYNALKMAEKLNNVEYVAKSTTGIGLVHFVQKDWEIASDYFVKSLKSFRRLGNIQKISQQQYLIGLCLTYLKQFENAKNYLDSALQLKIKLNDVKGINECYIGFAELHVLNDRYDSAIFYYNKALPFYLEKNETMSLARINVAFANLYLKKGQLKKALEYAQTAERQAGGEAQRDRLIDAKDLLSRIYLELGDHKRAMHYQSEYFQLRDSIHNRDAISKINSMYFQYESEKLEAMRNEKQRRVELEFKLQLNEQSAKKRLLVIVIISLFVLVVVSIFAYRWVSRERKISDDMLLNILPKQTSWELKKYGKAIPKTHPDVSILFCDVVGFTIISEKLTPEQLVDLLDFYIGAIDQIIDRYGLEKIKTIGDAYMCVGGLLAPGKQSAIDTVNAAVEILKFSHGCRAEVQAKYGCHFEYRVGINTGNVVSGIVGTNKYSYDIWGDTVNTAARMEQMSEVGKINVTGSTYELIQDTFACTYRGKIGAKNKGDIDMYFVEMT